MNSLYSMWIAILSGLLVSVDALFIGVSLGSQKKCKYWHVLVINAFLIGLCLLGYLLGIWIGERVDIELDIVIGITFILLGIWTIVSYFIMEQRRAKKRAICMQKAVQSGAEVMAACCTITDKKQKFLSKETLLTGIFMSIEAMFITIGLTLVLEVSTVFIPLTVGLAHFAYATATFFLAKHLRRLPPIVGPIVAGLSLVAYGILAFFL